MIYLKNFQLKTSTGLELDLLNYGARVHSLRIPINGEKINIALGYENIKHYLDDEYYLGATIGRFGNRLHGGKITLNGLNFNLLINEIDNANTLHGGHKGFDKQYWDVIDSSNQFIEFKFLSPHLDQGFPGALDVRARYSVENLGFTVEYSATCNQDTLVNLCNHTYFNLDGFNHNGTNSIVDHQLLVYLDKFLQLNDKQVPSGVFQNVTDTPFDFRVVSTDSLGNKISKTLESEHPQIKLASGLDHTFIKRADYKNSFQKVTQLYSSKSNIALKVYTTQPGVHIYSGNYLHNRFNKHSGICFETQGYPDAPNHKHFPSSLLKAGEKYHHKTTYQFELLK